jgi:hypothetical protein
MNRNTIDRPAYHALHRGIAALCTLIWLVALWVFIPIAVKQIQTSTLDAVVPCVMIAAFALLALLCVDRVTSRVSLDSDGLTYRGLLRRVSCDWPSLFEALSISGLGGHYYMIDDGARRKFCIPCADSEIRMLVGEARIRGAILEKPKNG